VEKIPSALSIWRYNHKCRQISTGKLLRIELLAPALIHWSADDWWTTQDIRTTDSELGIHFADLPTDRLPVGCMVRFTFLWLDANRWEGANFDVVIGGELCG
jgi:glucoamylase